LKLLKNSCRPSKGDYSVLPYKVGLYKYKDKDNSDISYKVGAYKYKDKDNTDTPPRVGLNKDKIG